MSALGLDRDLERMNVVLGPKDEDAAAQAALAKMYISATPRTGVLNK
jgi:hypothetical protein